MPNLRPPMRLSDPAPLGLAAFGVTTFMLGAYYALGGTRVPLIAVVGWAIFVGGLAQFVAGMLEFMRRNVYGATVFSMYGAFSMGLAAFITLMLLGKVAPGQFAPSMGLVFLAFFIFNTYVVAWATRINLAILAIFLAMEVAELLLWIGEFAGSQPGTGLVGLGGWFAIVTAVLAWYASAVGIINGMAARPVLPIGGPLWGEAAPGARSARRPPRTEP